MYTHKNTHVHPNTNIIHKNICVYTNIQHECMHVRVYADKHTHVHKHILLYTRTYINIHRYIVLWATQHCQPHMPPSLKIVSWSPLVCMTAEMCTAVTCSSGQPGTSYVEVSGVELAENCLPSAGVKGMCHHTWLSVALKK